MSNTKTVMSQAANTQGLPLDITDVFSTYLYTGNGSTQTITNGIDLDGEGGLVWTKSRSTQGHVFCDTEQGVGKYLSSNQTWATVTNANVVNAFNSDGYSIGSEGDVNANTYNFASWTFRKAPKFFDVVTWTGNIGNRTISHSLNSEVGMIVLKKTSATGDWYSYHRSLGNTKAIALNSTGAAISPVSFWQSTTPTATEFYVNSDWNDNGQTYVAYLFAHNDGDGEFGPDGDQDIIKCGSYTGNGLGYVSGGNIVDIGFEPQWVMVIPATLSGYGSTIFDSMRGIVEGNVPQDPFLQANTSAAESSPGAFIAATASGFKIETSGGYLNENGQSYIYIAIRRGPLAPPESGTEVFAVDTGSTNDPAFDSGFPVDFAIFTETNTNTDNDVATRLLGTDGLRTNSTAAAVGPFSDFKFDFMDGWNTAGYGTNTVSWMWKRAPNFFDVVTYTGDGTAGRTVSHNLGVAPEMMIVKSRSSTYHWFVYHQALTSSGAILLSQSGPSFTGTTYWNGTDPTASDFTLGTSTNVNGSAKTYIAYLFASLDGVSKVGSYTGNGTSQTIDCGFTSGARFVLIKRTDGDGNWLVSDTERGITSGNDSTIQLNTTDADNAFNDTIDPNPVGFDVVQGGFQANASGAEYIFYAIA